MGSKYSLPDRIDKETFKFVTGEFYSEQLWVDYSRNDFIPKEKLNCMEKIHVILQENPEATNIYEGGMRFGKKEGYGLYIYPSGDLYDGEWCADERHGYGKFFDMTSGDVMSGTWIRDKMTGEGKFVGSSGPIYSGGHGRLVPSVGDVYNGGFVENRRHGFGRMVYSKTTGNHRGEIYEGEWIDDVRHGHGVCKYSNGNTYDGEWVNGERCGPGIMTFKNGDVYAGHYFGNVMHGKGTYTPNGCPPQEAEWINGDRVVEEIKEASSEDESVKEFDLSEYD